MHQVKTDWNIIAQLSNYEEKIVFLLIKCVHNRKLNLQFKIWYWYENYKY